MTSENLLTQIAACRVCRDEPKYGSKLPHEPRPVCVASAGARILIAGQAPGTRVHASGIPFDDPSGDRLRAWMDVSRETFYDPEKIAIVPMGFCFPGLDKKGSDLPPRRECRDLWRAKVLASLPGIRLTLVIGQYAHAYHLGKLRRRNLTQTVAEWKQIREQNEGRLVYAMPHPSWRNNVWLKKNKWFETDLLPELRATIKEILV